MYYYSIAKDGKTHGSQRGVYAISSVKRLSLSLRLLTERVMIMMMREMIGMRNLANYRDGSIQNLSFFWFAVLNNIFATKSTVFAVPHPQ